MNIDIKDVHVGQAIDQRRNELGLSKSELGRRLGIPQQHINRLLERETMTAYQPPSGKGDDGDQAACQGLQGVGL